MTLDHRATSADIARHVYTDADHRAAEALLSDVMPDDTRILHCPRDYEQDLDRGPWADQARRERSGLVVLMLALIAFLASVAIATILGVRWWP